MDACDTDLSSVRNRALILIGFADALLRSELVALQRKHLRWTLQGMVLRTTWSKADNNCEDIGIPHSQTKRTCPITHARRWIGDAAIKNNSLFCRIDRWGKLDRESLSTGSARLVLGTPPHEAGLVGTNLELTRTDCGLSSSKAYSNGIAGERIIGHTRQKA